MPLVIPILVGGGEERGARKGRTEEEREEQPKETKGCLEESLCGAILHGETLPFSLEEGLLIHIFFPQKNGPLFSLSVPTSSFLILETEKGRGGGGFFFLPRFSELK